MLAGIIIVYFGVLIGIGLFSYKRTKTPSDFFVAGRKLGLLTTAASLSATGIGGSATIVACIYVYTKGLPGIWMNLAAGLGLLLLGFVLAKKVRRMDVFSLPEMLGVQYGKKARFCASLLVILAEIAWLALVIQATQIFLSVILDIDHTIAIYIATFIFVAYTFLGGQFAVSYSDIFQSIVMFAGIVILSLMVLFHKVDGVPLLSGLPKEVTAFPVGPKMGILDVISLILLMGLPHMVGSDVYAKLLSSSSENVAKNASIVSGVFRIVWGIVIAVIALGALKIFPSLDIPATILPRVITYFYNPFIAGLILVAFIAAMMSSADTILLTGVTVLTHDILKLSSGKKSLFFSRIFVIVIGIMGLLLALYFKDIIKTLELAYTVFASGLIIPIIAGFFKDTFRVNETGAIAAMIGGGGLSLLIKLGNINILPHVDPVLIGLAVSILFLFVFSLPVFRREKGRQDANNR